MKGIEQNGPVDLTNWASHYGINPAAIEALQSMLASTPAAPVEFDRARETPRRQTAVEAMLAMGFVWDNGAWCARSDGDIQHQRNRWFIRAGEYLKRAQAAESKLTSTPAAPGIDLSGVRGLVDRWRNANLRADMGWKEALVICLSDLDLQLALIDTSPKGGHCTTCACDPNMTPAIRYDLSPAAVEGEVRNHLIALGWTPPDSPAAPGIDLAALEHRVRWIRDITANPLEDLGQPMLSRVHKFAGEALELIERADASPKGGSEHFQDRLAEIEGRPRSEPEVDEVEEVAACLGDDAAAMLDENPEDERALNMKRAAELLTELQATSAEVGP